MNIAEELSKIEEEERIIEAGQREIERKEDLIRVFEELGLMRWKSYYILTAGAILLLALTFVTSLWVMHDQLLEIQTDVNAVAAKVSIVEDKLDAVLGNGAIVAADDWCLPGQKISLPGEDFKAEALNTIFVDGVEKCRAAATSEGRIIEIIIDRSGNFEISS